MKHALHGLVLALQFLTRLPIPIACPWNAVTCRWALRCYPLVGLLIGVLLAILADLGQALPTPLLAMLLLSLWVGLSGGLHLDGVMDVADAIGSNASLEQRWAIMKDSQIGSFAILSLVFLLVWKGMLLWSLLAIQASPWSLVALPALARFGALVLLRLAPCAQREGLAWTWRQHLSRYDLALALVPLLLVFGWQPGGIWLLAALSGFLGLYGLLMVRLFTGINGDIVGAAIEGGELWLLLCVWSWWWFVMG
ncbi:adenosylcobinamide-GDP ribazoletransferase [Aidingimonas halophila]|uniref:Adenosylcobinamide-GDP ribazoletransferase n=1 Tax=Aidingimonas halophila TaxID=574349 RepID=A0A1H2XJB6_9GAMM|nr:adenosylcobinamide-GDP ribazoletransferase [Aidingimonas halophila]GHC28759.1 adenosylcobinamide-GDP ribazoletransferase [Aidingimonas halophila]SDW92379.1 cobalamin-5'-phosphate synthase [Aidingimonas halophila]